MPKKFLVTLSGPDDAAAVKESGCEVLAEYPDTVLVECEDEEQEKELHSTGLEAVEAPTPPVRVLGLSFAMADAVSTEASMPPPDPSRPNYYVAQLVGPAKGEWLKQLSTLGASPSPLHELTAAVRVEIDGIDSQVQFAGAAPQLVFGVVQVNAEVPSGVTPGNAVSLQVFIDNVPAQGGLSVAVS